MPWNRMRHQPAGRAIVAPLVAKYPNRAVWKDHLAWFDRQLAAIGQ